MHNIRSVLQKLHLTQKWPEPNLSNCRKSCLIRLAHLMEGEVGVKQLVSRAIPDKTKGRLEYYIRPRMRSSWGGPFNGQRERINIFKSIVSSVKIDALLETGTFRGTSTKFFAQNIDCPIYTVEYMSRNVGFASEQLRGQNNVVIEQGDSRSFLRKMASRTDVVGKTVFVYLDAHWYDDLPLADELDIVFSSRMHPVVMVDDFKVPGDDGYGYDDYGAGKALTVDYIAAAKQRFGLSAFFPSARSKDETGAARGCVVLCNQQTIVSALRDVATLREWPQAESRDADLGRV